MEPVFANIVREGKGLLPLTYCRSYPRQIKAVDNRLEKAYNWIKDHDFIPADATSNCTPKNVKNFSHSANWQFEKNRLLSKFLLDMYFHILHL